MDPAIAAGIAAQEAIDAVLTRVIAHGHEATLRAREVPFAVSRMIQELGLIIEHQMPPWDALAELRRPPDFRVSPAARAGTVTEGSWEPEEEPTPPPIDSWARASLPVRVRPAAPALVSVEKVEARSTSSFQSGRSRPLIPAASRTARTSTGPSNINNGAAATARAGETRGHIITARAGSLGSESAGPSVQVGDLPRAAPRPPPSPSRSEAGNSRSRDALDARKEVGREEADAGARGSEAQKREPLDAKKIKGRTLTTDERGNLLVVNPPNVSRLPITVIPVAVTVDADAARPRSSSRSGSRSRPAGAGPLLSLSLDATSAASSSPRNAQGSTARTGTRSPRQQQRAPSMSQLDERFFRASLGVQPPLTDTIKTTVTSLSPGVTIQQAGKTVHGPDQAATDPRRPTRAAFEQRKKTLARSASLLAAAQKAAGSPEIAAVPSTERPPGDADMHATRLTDGAVDTLRTLSGTDGGARPLGARLLATVPDKVQSALDLSRTMASTASAARSPIPGSSVPSKRHGNAGLRMSAEAAAPSPPDRVSSYSPGRPGSMQFASQGSPGRASAIGGKRPRERGTLHTVPTTEFRHLPPPPFPAVARFERVDDPSAIRTENSLSDAVDALEQDVSMRRGSAVHAESTVIRDAAAGRSVLSSSGRQVLDWGETSLRKTSGRVVVGAP